MDLHHQQRTEELGTLIEQFQQYGTKADEYNTRAEYIDKLFTLLGWDMYNNNKAPAHLKQVLREDTVYINGGAKAPDYSFRIDGKRLFFVEAKKPNVNIHDNADYAFQARSYGYSASEIPIVILTDFQEFSVYDANIKPKEGDSAGTARLKYFACADYTKPEVFTYLWDTFSFEAVKNGSLSKYAKEIKKGGESFDTEFLKSLSQWRLKLADAIFLKNKDLHEIHANYAVQKIMNRLIFLRFAEDRGTSNYGSLQAIANRHENRYQALKQLFDEARTVYNSEIFGTEPADKDKKAEFLANRQLLDGLIVDDKTIKEIIDDLYFPKSPYAFSVIPIELLGTIYERFLGQKIIRGKYNRAEAVDKIENRKGQGIYYTPAYIVDYIVQNTLGKLLDGKTPEDIKTLAIADPACGSGSFLIAVYDSLLRWYLHYYSENNPKTHLKANKIAGRNGEYTLTVGEKQQILLRHVYGVDLDSQAVEVSKLSLMLKLMEGENHGREGKLTFLPNLEGNIQWGNSLICTDYTKDMQLGLFGMEEQHKIKVFDWAKAFPAVFARGGFDCIVGNPPYVRNRILDQEQKNYFIKNYESAKGQYDLYQLFYEQGIGLLAPNRYLGFITSNKFTIADYGKALRNYILNTSKIHEIIDVSNINIFREAATYPYIVILEKEKYNKKHRVNFKKIVDPAELSVIPFQSLSQSEYAKDDNMSFIIKAIPPFFNKIESLSNRLGDLVTIKETIHTGNVREKLITQKKEDNNCKKLLYGRDSHRYCCVWDNNYIRYDKSLINKANGEYANLCNSKYFENPKILLREIAYNIECYYDEEAYYTLNKLYSLQKNDDIPYNYLYLTGILNSKLLSYYFRHKFEDAHVSGGYLQFKKMYTSQLPIRALDLGDKAQKKQHDDLAAKVQEMLEFHKKLHAAKDMDKLAIKGQIAALDRQIDALVYKLYGLDEAEIQVVEGKA